MDGLQLPSQLLRNIYLSMVESPKGRDTLSHPTPAGQSPGNVLPQLPRAITSFGAAMLDGSIFVHGGHHGQAHHYSKSGQSDALWRLDLNGSQDWQTVTTGRRLQGHAMIPYGDSLYVVGGFEARNTDDQEQDLWSVADFVRFQPERQQWTPLAPLPDARSSFDAVLLDGTIYVVGGWSLQGARETSWVETAYACDLSEDSITWREMPRPGFQRRALALGASGGRVVVIGGMQSGGEVTTCTAVYDPGSGTWEEGPKLPGDDMEGFGAACCAAGDRLYVSTASGKLLRLSDDGGSWQLEAELGAGRFFHRMLPLDARRLVLLGGANMQQGKFREVEVVALAQ